MRTGGSAGRLTGSHPCPQVSGFTCSTLQTAMGTSDLRPPPAAAVRDCGGAIGPKRRFFGTADTVEDLELLRRALGVDKLTLDGVSYGTFVAERYALAHPERVERLVLDSVVPHDAPLLLAVDNMQATARVLRAACREQRCASDPAQDLAWVVRSRGDGPQILDALVTLSIVDPRFAQVPEALRDARDGQRQRHCPDLPRLAPDPRRSGPSARHRAAASARAAPGRRPRPLHPPRLCPAGGPPRPQRHPRRRPRAGHRREATATQPKRRSSPTPCRHWHEK